MTAVQRRHPDDTGLQADGPIATQWLSIAQLPAGLFMDTTPCRVATGVAMLPR